VKIPNDLPGRVRLLEKAQKDKRLQAFLSSESASAFGAYPLGTEKETLVVAVPAWADLTLYPLLGRAIGRPIRPVPMESDLVLGYIFRAYLTGEFPNFHTFPDPEFVTEENLPLLITGKVEPLPPSVLKVPKDHVLLLDLALQSDLKNLDRYEGDMRIHPGEMEIPFSRENSTVRVFGGAVGEEVRILLKLSYRYEGMEHRHGFTSKRLEDLPFVLHPTELQLLLARDKGDTGFWVFDSVQTVPAGERATLSCTYHFLNFANRYRRTLTLKILGTEIVPVAALRIEEGDSRWTLDDFDRWFGRIP
jgi:hypothetical protein